MTNFSTDGSRNDTGEGDGGSVIPWEQTFFTPYAGGGIIETHNALAHGQKLETLTQHGTLHSTLDRVEAHRHSCLCPLPQAPRPRFQARF